VSIFIGRGAPLRNTPSASRLGKLCGNGPDLWLNLQKRYDLRRAEQELGEKIKAIPTLEVA
jgi:plasmid maintenance system antidote protein VapI